MSSESINVLLVEDNLGDARLMSEALKEAPPGQFQLTHVRRLSEALEFLWAKSCGVVLLDLGLPDSHGIDTLLLVRAQAPAVPIVVLTGFQDESLADQAMKEGAQDYLVKGQADSKLVARSLRYAIARKVAEEALVRQGVAVANAGELQRSRHRLLAIHERVRRDIAAQLRDGLHEQLLILKGQLQELLDGPGSAPEAARVATEAIHRLDQVIEPHLAALSRRLYPSALSHGLLPAFQAFPDQFGAALALEIELDEKLVLEEMAGRHPVPEHVALALYRIAEEALLNAARHAKAAKTSVRLERPRDNWLRLTVRDDGRGFDLESAPPGLGLAIMQDYAGNAQGKCLVRSSPGAGTEVTAVLPFSRPDSAEPLLPESGLPSIEQVLPSSRPDAGQPGSLENGNN
jgi:signal transduction histidine kinase